MSGINLKRLLSNKETRELLYEVANAADIVICVRDSEGTILTGSPPEPRRQTGCDPSRQMGRPHLRQMEHPVTAGGRVIGYVLGPDKARAAASVLNRMAAVEIEKKALAAETLDRYTELATLYDFVEKVGMFDTREVAGLLIDQLGTQIKADGISVMLLNERTGMLDVIAARGRQFHPRQEIKAGQYIAGSVLLSGKAEIVNDVTRDERYVPGANTVSSLMCAPLKSKGRTLGVVNVSAETPFNYTSEDLKFFTTLVSQAAVAIDNARLYEDLKETFLETVHTLAETIEKRDPYTGGHTRRVMQYSNTIGRVLELDAAGRERLDLSAVLHDIGKIGVKDSVLLKTGKLDELEFTEIKKHPGYGEEILSYIKNLKEIIPGVKSHHERFDGRGYPEGLKGDAIDITARIIAVADSFDAMTTNRPYRKGLNFEAAFEELKKCSGGQFDPAVVDAFFKAYESNMIEEKETFDGKNTDS